MESLRVEGALSKDVILLFPTWLHFPDQIPDVSQLLPGREGGGVRLRVHISTQSLRQLQRSTLRFNQVTGNSLPVSHSKRYAMPLSPIALGNEPLPEKKGGPFRFLIPNVDECAIGGVDACANVKFLARIELSQQPGQDNRPTSKASHEEHHTKEGHEHLEHK